MKKMLRLKNNLLGSKITNKSVGPKINPFRFVNFRRIARKTLKAIPRQDCGEYDRMEKTLKFPRQKKPTGIY